MEKSIAILMCTYNGEKWLRCQLDSILGQTEQNYTLYVRDDGSTDGTFNIIKEYAQRYSNVVLLEDNTLHRGAAEGFRWLLREVEADYYFFSDQDDFWLPEKVQLSMERIKNEDNTRAIALHTDLKVVDSELNQLYPSFYAMTGRNPKWGGRLGYACAYHAVTGCTSAFNRKVRDLMLRYADCDCLHDELLGLVVAGCGGELIYFDIPTVLYRQHGNNVLGACRKTLVQRIKGKAGRWHQYRKWYRNVKRVTGMSVIRFVAYKAYYTVRQVLRLL